MKTKITLICALALLALSTTSRAEEQAAAQAPAPAPAPATAPDPSGDTAIVTVNGKDISLDLFRRFYNDRLHQSKEENSPATQNRIFNEFVILLVTAQDAEHSGLAKDKGLQLALELQRLQLLSNFAIQNAADTLQPSDEELRQAYDTRFGKEQGLEYKARHILVATEEEGVKIVEELKGGADFAELAKVHSLGPTGKDGGELPWFGSGQMVQSFTDATAAMEPGEHSQAPVQSQFGWHVILLEDTRKSEPPQFEDVKDELARALQRTTVARYIDELRKKTELVLNPELIKMGDSQKSGSEESE